MSSSEKVLVQESLRDFTEGLYSLVPLRHFTEYHEEDKIRKAAQQESNNVLNSFIKKTEAQNDLRVKGDLLKELCLELEKLIEDHIRKNQEYKAEAESFLKKRTNDLCEDFKGTFEAKLLLSPDINLKSAEELLENGKMLALCYFENHSNFGNIDSYEEQKKKLQEKLEVMCKEMLEKHGHFLEIRARKSLGEIKKIVLNMSGEIQRDISTLDEVVSGNQRKAKLVKDYLSETGTELNEDSQQLRVELCETLDGVIAYLNDSKENMYVSLEDGIGWAGRLDQLLKTFFIETESSTATTTDLQNEGNEGASNEIIQMSKSASQEPDESDLVGADVDIQVGSNMSLGKCAQPVEVVTQSGPTRNENIPNDDLEMGAKEDLQKAPVAIDSSPTSNEIQQNDQDSTHGEIETTSSTDLKLSFPAEDEFLLRAIWEDRSVTSIKKMLDEGANVNVKSTTYDEANAAHVVIALHGINQLTTEEACVILNVLVTGGFNLINEGDGSSLTPLLQATSCNNLDEELLTWFFKNGADFNASFKDDVGNSVLLHAIFNRHDAKIIRKILDCGADPTQVNYMKANAVHVAAEVAHASALEIFIDKLDINAMTTDEDTPLHLLFMNDGLDYLPCLELLLKNGADFEAKNDSGYYPMVEWMKCCEGNPFNTLLKVKDILPITEEIAAATLTAIVEEMESLKEILPLPSSQAQNDLADFIKFLIKERKGKLQLKNEHHWQRQMHGKLENVVLCEPFLKALQTTGNMKWKGEFNLIQPILLGRLEFCTSNEVVGVAIETVLLCLLVSENYQGFVEVCQCLIQSGCLS